MRQTWRDLAFLHWEVPVAALRALVPAALEIDTFDGRAFVGVVPFTIPRSHAPLVPVPILPAFHELNVRTYVHRRGRHPGVWFFSLDAASRLAVAGARLGYALPYRFARMTMDVRTDGGERRVGYESRRVARTAVFRGVYGPSGPVQPAAPGTLEHFLAERYLLYAHRAGVLLRAHVEHAPYPLQAATAEVAEESVLRAAGLPATGEPLAHYASGVDVHIYAPFPVPGA